MDNLWSNDRLYSYRLSSNSAENTTTYVIAIPLFNRLLMPLILGVAYPWLYYVIYSNNYASYEVLNYQLEKVVGPISLINHG